MNILLTNDDGIYAEGLLALYKRFAPMHCVTIVAPDRERSAEGHGITLGRKFSITRVVINGRDKGYAVNGTPADCVKLSVMEILDGKPDMVISGINAGANVGVNVNYSGTVSAAREAALYGVPAIAASIYGKKTDHYDDAALFIELLAKIVLEKGLPFGTFLNVNIPNLPIKKAAGIQISRQGINQFLNYFKINQDLKKCDYYWQGCDSQNYYDDIEIDGDALCNNFISITPIKCDMTDYSLFEDLKKWNIDYANDP